MNGVDTVHKETRGRELLLGPGEAATPVLIRAKFSPLVLLFTTVCHRPIFGGFYGASYSSCSGNAARAFSSDGVWLAFDLRRALKMFTGSKERWNL